MDDVLYEDLTYLNNIFHKEEVHWIKKKSFRTAVQETRHSSDISKVLSLKSDLVPVLLPPPFSCPTPEGHIGLFWWMPPNSSGRNNLCSLLLFGYTLLLSRRKASSLYYTKVAKVINSQPPSFTILKDESQSNTFINIWFIVFQTWHRLPQPAQQWAKSWTAFLWASPGHLNLSNFALCRDRSSFESTLWARGCVPWPCWNVFRIERQRSWFYSQALCCLNKVIVPNECWLQYSLWSAGLLFNELLNVLDYCYNVEWGKGKRFERFTGGYDENELNQSNFCSSDVALEAMMLKLRLMRILWLVVFIILM